MQFKTVCAGVARPNLNYIAARIELCIDRIHKYSSFEMAARRVTVLVDPVRAPQVKGDRSGWATFGHFICDVDL